MFWLLLALMCVLAIAFVAWPFARARGSAGIAIAAALLVVGLSAGIYRLNGEPGVPSGRSGLPEIDDTVATLAARLEARPDDVAGWKMLGRSYMSLERYGEAVDAYAKAVELENAQNAQTLVDYGVALARAGGDELSPRAIAVFENAIALAPTEPQALFWGGIAAANRGDEATAADRWEQLAATNPPPEVRAILDQRIALWRGETPAEAPAAGADAGPVVEVEVTVADAVRAALPEDASVFVIARDPAQPSPPIAVARRVLSELPTRVELSDADAMIPGRNLSAFPVVEVMVRASASGEPIAAPGDWFGSVTAEPGAAGTVAVEIAQPVR